MMKVIISISRFHELSVAQAKERERERERERDILNKLKEWFIR